MHVDFDNKSLIRLNNTASRTIGYDKDGKVNEISFSGSAGFVKGNYEESTNSDGKPKEVQVLFETHASNKLVTGISAPAIDAKILIIISPLQDGSFNYSIIGVTDGFPAYELWVRDDKGNGILVFGRNPIDSHEGPFSLFSPMEHVFDFSGNSKDAKKGPIVRFDQTKNPPEKF